MFSRPVFGDTKPIVGPARPRAAWPRLALSIRWSIVARAAFSPEQAEQKRDIAALIRAYFGLGRLMACSSRDRPREGNPNCRGIFLLVEQHWYYGPREICRVAAVRATMNDTPRRRAPVVMILPAGNGLSVLVPRHKQSIVLRAATIYVTNRRGSRPRRERLSLLCSRFPLKAARRNCITQRVILLSHQALCKWRAATQQSHVLVTGESPGGDANLIVF